MPLRFFVVIISDDGKTEQKINEFGTQLEADTHISTLKKGNYAVRAVNVIE